MILNFANKCLTFLSTEVLAVVLFTFWIGISNKKPNFDTKAPIVYLQKGIGLSCSNSNWANVQLRADSETNHEQLARDLHGKIPQWDELAYQGYWHTGNRTKSEEMMYEMQRLDKIIFAYCKSQNKQLLKLIEEWLILISETTWPWPAHNDPPVYGKKVFKDGVKYYIELNGGELWFKKNILIRFLKLKMTFCLKIREIII